MSDPSLELGPGLRTWLETGTEVIAAFAPKTALVFDENPPTNHPKPYGHIAGLSVDDDSSECLDATLVQLQLDVWSKTLAEARRIARAFKARVLAMHDEADSPIFSIAGFRIVTVQALSTLPLTDPSDGRTIHMVMTFTLAVDPL